jgi:hypothetical protein
LINNDFPFKFRVNLCISETINKTGVVMVSSALFNRQIDAEASQVLSPAGPGWTPFMRSKVAGML